jgi:hypothetical protein
MPDLLTATRLINIVSNGIKRNIDNSWTGHGETSHEGNGRESFDNVHG